MEPADWHKIRSVIMIAVMKAVSVSVDKLDTNYLPNILEYTGYIFGATTCFFGPWIPFKDYIASLHYKKSESNTELIKNIFKNIFNGGKYIFISLFFLSVSNCWMTWLLSDSNTRQD